MWLSFSSFTLNKQMEPVVKFARKLTFNRQNEELPSYDSLELPSYRNHKKTFLLQQNVETKAQRKTREHYEKWLNDKRVEWWVNLDMGMTTLSFDDWLMLQEPKMPRPRSRRQSENPNRQSFVSSRNEDSFRRSRTSPAF